MPYEERRSSEIAMLELIKHLDGSLSDSERAEILRFVDVDEYTVAFETLLDILNEEQKRISVSDHEQILRTGRSLGYDDARTLGRLRSGGER